MTTSLCFRRFGEGKLKFDFCKSLLGKLLKAWRLTNGGDLLLSIHSPPFLYRRFFGSSLFCFGPGNNPFEFRGENSQARKTAKIRSTNTCYTLILSCKLSHEWAPIIEPPSLFPPSQSNFDPIRLKKRALQKLGWNSSLQRQYKKRSGRRGGGRSLGFTVYSWSPIDTSCKEELLGFACRLVENISGKWGRNERNGGRGVGKWE